MIDTDKYEGHLIDKAVEEKSQVWAWNEWMLKNSKTVDVKNITATIELLNDAPKLLAEVKRLTKTLELIGKNMPYDSWMHTLIKEVTGYEKVIE